MENQVCIFGALVADLIVEVNEMGITPGGWQIANNSQFNPGGIAIVAKMISQLGSYPKLCGWIGNDAISKEILADLDKASIKTSSIISYDAPTIMILVFVDKHGNHSRVVINNSLPPKKLPSLWVDILNESKIAFLDGYTCIELPEEVVYEIVDAVNERNIKLIFDPQKAAATIPEQLLSHIVERTDVLSLNQFEAEWLAKVTDGRLSSKYLIEKIETVFFRRGPWGSELYNNGKKTSFPGNNIPAVNSLGAGDCYNGTLIYGLANDIPLEKIGILANQAGAVAVTKMETGAGIPTKKEIQSMLMQIGQGDLYSEFFSE